MFSFCFKNMLELLVLPQKERDVMYAHRLGTSLVSVSGAGSLEFGHLGKRAVCLFIFDL